MDIPTKINANAVSVTKDIPVNMGLDISRNENRIPITLVKATLPQFNIFRLFISKEKPNSWNERNISVNPTTKGSTANDTPGLAIR